MKKIILATYGLLILTNLYAQNSQAGNGTGVARGIAAEVKGKVDLVGADSEKPQTLAVKDVVRQKDAVKVGESSEATLLFSNGATIVVAQNSDLVISEFHQDPFVAPFIIGGTSKEPSTSTMKLELKKGEIICDSKKLRVDKGSSLTINTPVGAVGIKGTRFQVTYTPGVGGAAGTYNLSVAEGSVTFFNDDGTVDIVEAGTQIEIKFTSREGANGVEVTITERRKGPASQARLDEINRKAEEALADVDSTVFPPDNDVLELRTELADALQENIDTIIESPAVSDPNPPSN